MSLSLKVCITAVALFLVPACFAQYPQTPDTATGLSPMSVYNVGDIDNVNPANGNLFLDIPLLSYPQRGHKLHLDFKIYYNDKAWSIIQSGAVGYNPNDGAATLSGVWSWFPNLGTQVDDIGVYVGRDQKLTFGDDPYVSTFTESAEPYDTYTITTTLNGYYVRSADGSKHYYADSQFQTCSTNGGGAECPQPLYSGNDGYGNSYPSTDGSGYFPVGFNPSLDAGIGTVIDANGVTYTLTGSNPQYEKTSDPSGNIITTSANGWQDTIGRNIPGSYSLPGFSGDQDYGETTDPIPGVPVSPSATTCPSGTYSAREWIVPSVGSGDTATYYLCYKQFSFQTAFDLPNSYELWYSASDVSSTDQGFRPAVLLSNIMLPTISSSYEPQMSYTFTYDQYLSLTSITLPTGASISYTWQNVYFDTSQTSPISRALLTRTVNPGNGDPERVWHYQFLPNSSSSRPTMAIVTDPMGNDTEYHLTGADQISSISYYSGCSPDDTASTRACTGTSALLKTVAYTLSYYGSSGADAGTPSIFLSSQPTTTTTTWPASGGGNLVSKVVTTLTPSYGSCNSWGGFNEFTASGAPQQPSQNPETPCYSVNEPASIASYDFGSGAAGSLLKTVTTTYEWQTSSAYLNANLMDLPGSVVTTDGSGSKLAETDYYYDQSPSPQGAFGNLTSTVQWLNTGDSITNKTTYNTQGMPISTSDANNNTTTIAYDSTGAFPQTITHPATPGATHIDSYVYDDNTGLMTSHTDWNLNATTYSYINQNTGDPDPLNRLGEITFPATSEGQGYLAYGYSENIPGSPEVTVTELQSPTNEPGETYYQYDGLGQIRYKTISDYSAYTSSAETTYDSMGRIQSVSAPYVGGPDTAPPASTPITTFTYDALSRKTIQTQPDGTTLQWCYDGLASTGQNNCTADKSTDTTDAWVDYSDETGRHWQQVSDALGRLKAVMEPNASDVPALETDYQYDGLGNLLSVAQCGAKCPSATSVNRSFAYDSLSRLISASNPESGTVTYGYDADGNVISKTSPAPNDTSGTITTSYVYDALNRILSKISNDGAGTPAACYQYDITSLVSGKQNFNGHLTNQWTQPATANNGSCALAIPTSGTTLLTSKSILAYDSMGRLLSQQTCVYPNCTTTTPEYPLSYTYNLAGNLTSYTNGVNSSGNDSILLTNYYDDIGQLLSVGSSWDNTTHPLALFSQALYNPAGQLTSAGIGNGISLTRTYDDRSRITSETDQGGTLPIATPGTATITVTGSEQTQ